MLGVRELVGERQGPRRSSVAVECGRVSLRLLVVYIHSPGGVYIDGHVYTTARPGVERRLHGPGSVLEPLPAVDSLITGKVACRQLDESAADGRLPIVSEESAWRGTRGKVRCCLPGKTSSTRVEDCRNGWYRYPVTLNPRCDHFKKDYL